VRYKLTLAYRGTHYHGWQSQPTPDTWKGPPAEDGAGLATIQETLCRTMAGVLGHPVNVVGSSRTDAGVHAKGQIAHFDTDRVQIPPEGLRRAVNHRLPPDILIRAIDPADDTFDAIFCTTSKRYQYFIWNAPDRPVFFMDLAWHRWQNLDVPAMRAAAAVFRGTHDFASFAHPGHKRRHTIRTVHDIDIHFRPPKLIIGVEGGGFLWHMVRIMVGTLVEVGLGKYGPTRVADMLAAKNRTAAGPTAPPHGLYLQWVRCTPRPPERPAAPEPGASATG